MSTSIQWTDETWNPTGGCVQISPGCAHCYAKEQWDRRHKAHLSGKVMPAQYAQPFEVLQTFPDRLLEPLSWKKPRRVFVNSVSDLFHEDVPFEFIDRVFVVMAFAPQHTFQVLTKRVGRMREYFDSFKRPEAFQRGWNLCAWADSIGRNKQIEAIESIQRGLPNVWLGVSVENQHFADERIPLLLQTPAAVRFISAEPLLAPVNLSAYVRNARQSHLSIDVEGALLNQSFIGFTERGRALTKAEAKDRLRLLHFQGVKRIAVADDCVGFNDQTGCPGHPQPRLDWVIVGGESGPGARPFDIAWARNIVEQCVAAGVPVFVKQLGAVPMMTRAEWEGTGDRVLLLNARNAGRVPDSFEPIKLHDKKGGVLEQWPDDLRVRQFPEVRA